MSINKTIHLQKAIDTQLINSTAMSINNSPVSVKFTLNNIPFTDEFNVVDVESIDEANEIVSSILIEQINDLDASDVDYSKPLFLSVFVILPL